MIRSFRFSRIALAVLACGSLSLLSPRRVLAGTTPASYAPVGYSMGFSDNFSGTSLNTSNWDYRTDTKMNSVQEASNVLEGGGGLTINLDRVSGGISSGGSEYYATGGGIVTAQAFGYGYFETKMKLGNASGAQQGWHMSFWGMKANASGGVVATTDAAANGAHTEIDALEVDSDNSANPLTNAYSTQHVLPWNPSTDSYPTTIGGSYPTSYGGASWNATQWNTYSFLWTPTGVTYYINGTETDYSAYSASQYTEDPAINIWLTGISASFNNTPQVNSQMDIAYVDYYSPSPVPEPASVGILATGAVLLLKRGRRTGK